MSATEVLSALDRIHGTVSVIGSMNADYTVTAQRLPGPGETITGGPLQLLPGGKSGNQAAAAARIGATVQMFGAVGKTWLAHNLGVDADKIYSISIMPCIAKKAERELPSMDSAGHGSDVDLVITTRELARMARAEHLDVENIAESAFDSPLGDGTGAGVIFGATGGVMEAALRSAYFLTTGENPSPDAFREVRDDGTISPLPWREATFELAGRTVRCAVASGLGNARQLLHSLQRREVHYEFVEIMACPGGCAGGGGQPVDGTDREKAADRGKVLFRLDQNAPLRFSHENPAVQALYREYLDEPCSHRAEELLHCDHFAWQMDAAR